MSTFTAPSFWHESLPLSCLTPLAFVDRDSNAYFGLGSGTAFFARIGNEVFLFTARHCLHNPSFSQTIHQAAEALMIPYSLNTSTKGDHEYVRFDNLTQLAVDQHQGDFLDVVALHVRQISPRQHEILLGRSVMLPHTGLWLDRFVHTQLASQAMESGEHLPFVVAGYPNEGTTTCIHYPDVDGEDAEVQTQSVVLRGDLRRSAIDHCLRLENIEWPPGHEGLSGSPVFVCITTTKGARWALAGLVSCGSKRELNFVQVSALRQAALAPPLPEESLGDRDG